MLRRTPGDASSHTRRRHALGGSGAAPAGRRVRLGIGILVAAAIGVLALTGLPAIGAGTGTKAVVYGPSAKNYGLTPQQFSVIAGGWKLVWSDEFDDTAIDQNAWSVEDLSTYGDGNNELACLMERPENIRESRGFLTITARKEPQPVTCGNHDARFPDGRSYTSAMMNSRNKMDFEYGRFEMRARLPTAPGTSQGLWPAFWMRPTAGDLGELDILEAKGTGHGTASAADRVTQTIHYNYDSTHPSQANVYRLPAGHFSDGFHDFAVEWEPGSIRWFVDGALTFTRNTATTPWIDKAFSGPFYLRLNLAVGGNWPGPPDDDTVFPAEYQVDYVRVYQR